MKAWKPKLLGGKFTKLARAFSKNYNVTVDLSGVGACTDGNTIYLPANADHLKDEDQRVLEGVLDHEWSHVAEEQEAKERGTKSPMDYMRGCADDTERLMLNVFEDIRIEIKQGALYPGVADNLRASNQNSVKLYLKKEHSEDRDFWQLLGSAIIFRARDIEIDGWASERLVHLVDVVLKDEMRDALNQAGVSDAHGLALRTIAKMKSVKEDIDKAMEEDEGEEESGSGDEGEEESSGKGGGGESDGEGEEPTEGPGKPGEGSEKSDKGEEGEPTEGSDDESVESEDGEGSEGEGRNPAEVDRAYIDDIFKLMKGMEKGSKVKDMLDYNKEQIEEAARSDAASNGRYIPHPDAVKLDTWTRPTASKDDQDNYAARKAVAAKSISALRSKLLSVLRIRTQSFWAGDKEIGQLDAASLSGLRTGNRRIFSQHQQGESIDTVVSILVDQSGSMGRSNSEKSRAYSAQIACIALCETLDALGIPFQLVGFDNDWSTYVDASTHIRGQRIEPLRMVEYVGFNDSYKKRRATLCKINGNGNNTDGEAVLKVAQRLARRPEARKILIVLSDGQPAASVDPRLLNSHLKLVVKMVTDFGIEVLGVGIQSTAVKSFYNKDTGAEWALVEKLEELAPAIMSMFRKKMLSAGRKAA